MPHFDNAGLRIHYIEHGEGHPLVLMHGLLFSSRMFVRLRRLLPDHRVILLNLRGHGQSDRPADPALYTWTAFASDVAGLLDHLNIDRAVVGGLSLGANVSLATALYHTDRCAGLVIEMPVLERAREPATQFFGGLASAIQAGRPVLVPLGRLGRRLPLARILPDVAALQEMILIDPDSAAAIIRGLLLEDPLPELEKPENIAKLDMPALVIGHHWDPLHVFADAKELAEKLPGGRFVRASSILEFRFRPDRLAVHLRDFLDDVWASS